MWVTGQDERSAFKYFKIDKRAQVVITALSWEGAVMKDYGLNCNKLVGRIYNHVGISVDGASVTSVWISTEENGAQDARAGAIVFYRSPTQGFSGSNRKPWGDERTVENGDIAAHTAIRIKEATVIDCNCGISPDKVDKHSEDAPLASYPGQDMNPDPALDKKDRTPSDLIKLDAE